MLFRSPSAFVIKRQIRIWAHSKALGELSDLPKVQEVIETMMSARWPVSARYHLSSGFGDRYHPILKRRRFHSGVDIAIPTGTPIQAALDGKVQTASFDNVNGNYVVLGHGDGLNTIYCHASKLLVKEDDAVKQGEIFARSGSTGRSTGPHLHFGMRIGRSWVDPAMIYTVSGVKLDLGPLVDATPAK